MASLFADDFEEVDVFLTDIAYCKEEIIRKLEELERILNERKQVLLGEIAYIKERYEKSRETIKTLEKSRASILQSIIKVDNLLISATTRKDVINPLDNEINHLKIAQEIFTKIKVTFGDEEKTNNPTIHTIPSQIFNFNSLYGISIAFNGRKERQDCSSFERFKGYKIYKRQAFISSLWYICVNNDFVFITDAIMHKLLKFNRDGTFVKQIGNFGSRNNEFKYPYSLDIDSGNLLFVCDNDNNRLSVFNTKLEWQKSLTNPILNYPRDVKVNENIYVLCGDKTIYVFSKLFALVRKIKPISKFVNNPFWFCIDKNGHFLVSDRDGGVIKIFTPEGKLDSILGSKVQENEYAYCHDTQGIAINQDGCIVSVSSDINVSLKYF
ncbi:E3 ubiquitin-protein ligase TRIM71-like [Oopsacas minuta]|uniref:E3 ubiquitin-protein ligase TRIM71-like n=1 Tax=Oopsacas minuta TaxID=111878 RepID=A0AAV7JUN3_9METZ|nr:E3 ubiquitin-protein ligase TRIM71-like [Oopsacas minuta]